jgi:hypothetical protein
MRNQETGLNYAKFDHSDTRIRQAQYQHISGWRGAYIWCLKHQDYESAELIKNRNIPQDSDECFHGDHDLCHFGWCKCVCHSRVQFEIAHPQLRSLSEADSELEAELEAVS